MKRPNKKDISLYANYANMILEEAVDMFSEGCPITTHEEATTDNPKLRELIAMATRKLVLTNKKLEIYLARSGVRATLQAVAMQLWLDIASEEPPRHIEEVKLRARGSGKTTDQKNVTRAYRHFPEPS